ALASIAPARVDRSLALVAAVECLSAAQTLDDVIAVVRETAREISGADGVCFVMRDGDRCHYVEENAIGPLWKGRKVPMTACISGWCMLNKRSAVISDIYKDARIPHDAYRPTFVKSLVMVPVRAEDPLAAIGCYWASERAFSQEDALIEALARSTATALAAIQARAERQEATERFDRLQAEFAQAGGLNERGEMVTAPAHEPNQPLTAANNYLRAARQLLEMGSTNGTRLLEALAKTEAQLVRTGQTIQRIRGQADKTGPQATRE